MRDKVTLRCEVCGRETFRTLGALNMHRNAIHSLPALPMVGSAPLPPLRVDIRGDSASPLPRDARVALEPAPRRGLLRRAVGLILPLAIIGVIAWLAWENLWPMIRPELLP